MNQVTSGKIAEKSIAERKKLVIVSIFTLVFLIGIMATASVQVNAASLTLHVKPVKGIVNRSITVSGGGFLASSTITIKFGTIVVATTTANSSGGFATTFKVPQATAGVHTLTVSDGTNLISRSFTVVSHVTLKPKTGLPGATVAVTANGFAASSTVKITFNGVQIKSIKSNSTGGLSTSFVVPNDPAAAYPVVATDASSNTATATFTVT